MNMKTTTALDSFADSGDEVVHLSAFGEARLRLDERRSSTAATPRRTKTPEDIMNVREAHRPATRYFANRRAMDTTMKGYQRAVRRIQEILADVGFPHGGRDTPAERFPWHMVTVEQVLALRSFAEAHYASMKSIDNLFGIAREMFRHCSRAGLITAEERDELIAALPLRATTSTTAGREIGLDEIQRIYQAAASQPDEWFAARDAAILAVFIGTGLRVSEVANIDIEQLNLTVGTLSACQTKVGRMRQCQLPDVVIPPIQAWLDLRGESTGALFVNRTGHRLLARSLAARVTNFATSAGLQHLSTHDFRRTYVTRLLRNGVDPFTVARAVGHKHVSTTMLYDRRTEEEDREVVLRLNLPTLGASTGEGR